MLSSRVPREAMEEPVVCRLYRNQTYEFLAKSNGAEAAAVRDKLKRLVQVKLSEHSKGMFQVSDSLKIPSMSAF